MDIVRFVMSGLVEGREEYSDRSGSKGISDTSKINDI